MTLLIILLAVGLFIGIGASAWGLVLAGRVVRAERLSLPRAIKLALLWTLASGICSGIVLLVRNPGLTGPVWLVYFGSLFLAVKTALKLRFWRATGVVVLAYLIGGILAALVAVSIRMFVISPYHYPSDTMQPTVMAGDRLLANKLVYKLREPHRWEVAVFRFPPDPERPFLKRVVGLPGESVEIRDGAILINGGRVEPPPSLDVLGWKSDGKYALAGQPYTIPDDCYFVLGDNTSHSHDSRYWGCVPRKDLIGQAFCIFWPLGRIGEIK